MGGGEWGEYKKGESVNKEKEGARKMEEDESETKGS